jgi:hypothetical protein
MLARIGPELIPRGRQGVERRIPVHLLEALALTADLAAGLGVPAREAFVLSRVLMGDATPTPGMSDRDATPSATGSGVPVAVGDYVALHVDRQALRREIEDRLTQAIESVVRPRRGRPKRRD